ncbi:hypothetical protein F0U44_00210 [Nocardioides humilatus]|uniref:Glycosyltransferase RgtA/B/C/D-like domain-containing protein n=1 Tax=Nocardioides humilatus TaxID=2607660 RepID=A0A5B1LK26_9ACTN|nr:hypothetical protein [Nocardioides humilatus]KAA1420814.1 hypothetical protein F0U44_00210 [Nocardioides humilatus]
MVRRPLGETFEVLGNIDAVHGLYYLVLRIWSVVAGDSIVALRAFSALGLGVAAAATVLFVARYRSLKVAVAAGLVVGMLPGLTWTSVEARGYAWAAALAIFATLALDVAEERDTRRSWQVYGAVALLACWWHLYLVLLIVGHGITIAICRPDLRRTWLACAGAAAAGVAPLAWLAWRQRDQVAWLDDLRYSWSIVLEKVLAGSYPDSVGDLRLPLALCLIVLAVIGLVDLGREEGRWPVLLLGVWAFLPICAGLLSAVTDAGLVHTRYIGFAAPAIALLATLGAARLGRPVALGVALAGFVVAVPLLVAQRADDARPHDLRAVATSAGLAHPDAVLFTAPAARTVAYAYPRPFLEAEDLSAVRHPAPDPFFDKTRDPRTLAPYDVAGRRIVVIGTREVPDAPALRTLGCLPQHLHRDRGYQVWLYLCP